MRKNIYQYKELNSSYLIEYIKKELNQRSVNTSHLPDSKVRNEWQHFGKIHELAKIIPNSLSYKIREKKGKYGIYKLSFSQLAYADMGKLHVEAVNAKSYDLPAHILKPRYRSHYVHSFLVGALGWWMLEHIKFDGKYLKKHYDDFYKKYCPDAGFDLWDIWWSIALLHDIGYPVSLFWNRIPLLLSLCYNYPSSTSYADFIREIKDLLLLKNFNGPFSRKLNDWFDETYLAMLDVLKLGQHSFDKKFRKMIEERSQDFLSRRVTPSTIPIRDENRRSGKSLKDLLATYVSHRKDVDASANKFKQLDHGIASSIIALNFINRSYLEGDPLARLIFSPIVFHNLKSIPKENIHMDSEIDEDFDIFFLRLVDQIQEWGRGILIEKTNEILVESTRLKIGPFKKSRDYINLEEMGIVFLINNYRDVLTKSNWSFEVIKEDKKKAFELLKIDRKPLKLDIKIEVLSKFSCGKN